MTQWVNLCFHKARSIFFLTHWHICKGCPAATRVHYVMMKTTASMSVTSSARHLFDEDIWILPQRGWRRMSPVHLKQMIDRGRRKADCQLCLYLFTPGLGTHSWGLFLLKQRETLHYVPVCLNDGDNHVPWRCWYNFYIINSVNCPIRVTYVYVMSFFPPVPLLSPWEILLQN